MAPLVGFQAAHEQFTSSELVELGVLAEDTGFEAFVASDHFAPWMDNQGHAGLAWLTLAALGQRTRHIRLGTGVTCPTYRYNPAIVAQAFATLDGLYPGRIFLGVGTGEALNEVPTGGGWEPYKGRAARLREAITLIRRLWTGEWTSLKGAYYTLDAAKLYDSPQNPLPIYVAASGPKTAYLAGELGDGLITVGATHGETFDRVQSEFAAGTRSAGKDPAVMPRIYELYVVAGDEAEALAGAELWRHHGGLKGLLDVPDPREILRMAREQVDPRRVIDRWVVGRDPAVHIAALRHLGDLGFTHVTVHSPQADQRRFLEFYGSKVLPALHPTPA